MNCCESKTSFGSILWGIVKISIFLWIAYVLLPHSVFGEMFREIITFFRG